MSDELPRDEHLRAALRHAPDREAAAPAALSERILAQARAAAAPAPRPGFVERWLGWWSRPVAAGAFASLLIAGFVGLMWREGPPPEALPEAAPAATPAIREAPAQAAAPPPAAAPAPAPAPPAQAQRPPERRREREATRPALPPPGPAPAPAPMPAPAPAPAAAPPPPAMPRADQAATEQAAGRAAAAAKAVAAPDPLAAALNLLFSADDDPPLRERLAALRRRVQSAWTPAAVPPTPPEPLQATDGRLLGRLWIEPGRIVWQDPQGRAWQAALAP